MTLVIPAKARAFRSSAGGWIRIRLTGTLNQLFDHGGVTPFMREYATSCPMCSLQ
jgi:hypothetical protein